MYLQVLSHPVDFCPFCFSTTYVGSNIFIDVVPTYLCVHISTHQNATEICLEMQHLYLTLVRYTRPTYIIHNKITCAWGVTLSHACWGIVCIIIISISEIFWSLDNFHFCVLRTYVLFWIHQMDSLSQQNRTKLNDSSQEFFFNKTQITHVENFIHSTWYIQATLSNLHSNRSLNISFEALFKKCDFSYHLIYVQQKLRKFLIMKLCNVVVQQLVIKKSFFM
jgi:hypothetical protein